MITIILKSGARKCGLPSYENSPHYISNLYRFNTKPQTWQPPTDIYETEENYIILIEIAGMQESEFTVSIDQKILSVMGTRNSPIHERRAYHQMEIPFGDFITQLELPSAIDIEKTEASYDNGFLMINLLKEKPKHIDINRD